MIHIATHTFGNQDVEIMYNRGKIAYTFEVNGRRFGNAVKVEGKKKMDIINAAFLLILNMHETYAKALKTK